MLYCLMLFNQWFDCVFERLVCDIGCSEDCAFERFVLSYLMFGRLWV